MTVWPVLTLLLSHMRVVLWWCVCVSVSVCLHARVSVCVCGCGCVCVCVWLCGCVCTAQASFVCPWHWIARQTPRVPCGVSWRLKKQSGDAFGVNWRKLRTQGCTAGDFASYVCASQPRVWWWSHLSECGSLQMQTKGITQEQLDAPNEPPVAEHPLGHLDLSQLPLITDSGVTVLLATTPKLHNLNIAKTRCSDVTIQVPMLCVWLRVCLCGCVAVWLCGCVAVWLCGCVAVAVAVAVGHRHGLAVLLLAGVHVVTSPSSTPHRRCLPTCVPGFEPWT